MNKNHVKVLHRQIGELLRQKIETGEYKEGELIPSTSALCSQFNVSHITVRKAVSDMVSEGILLGIPGKGTFVTGKKEADINKKSRLVGVVFPEIAKFPFFSEIFHGIESSLSASGYHTIVLRSGNDIAQENRIIKELRERGVEGIILIPVGKGYTPTTLETFINLQESSFPVVLLDRTVPGLSFDRISSENEKGGYAATRHLIDLGHRRIAILLSIQVDTTMDRFNGYKRALKEAGIPFDPLMVKYSFAELDYDEFGYRNFFELMHLINPPTAVFSCNDSLTLGIYHACREMHLDIPNDISIVSYDNLYYTATLTPPLTTIAQPMHEMGQKAADLLLRRISGETGKPVKILMDNHLINRMSCDRFKRKQKRQKSPLSQQPRGKEAALTK